MKKTTLRICVLAALLVLSAHVASAGTVTVFNGGTILGTTVNVDMKPLYGPTAYTGGVYAGAEQLFINGSSTATLGFCIDLSRLVNNSLPLYTVDPLFASPAAPAGPMGIARAEFIKEMWATYYATAILGGPLASDFQLAIWGVVTGSVAGGVANPNWTWLTGGSHAGADVMINATNALLGLGPQARVDGLNSLAGNNQGYAIPGVPDGGTTVMLLGAALMGLGALRSKFRQ